MRLLRHAVRAAVTLAVVLMAAAAPAAAQVSMTFADVDDYFIGGSTMEIRLEIPTGMRLIAPRFHHIREGEPLPKPKSRGWIEFPEITASQNVKLRAPEEEGDWWLVLNDGNKLIARTSFDVWHWTQVLEFKLRKVCREQQSRDNPVPAGCEDWIAPMAATATVEPMPATSIATAEPAATTRSVTTPRPAPTAPTTKSLLRLASKDDIRAGDRVDVSVSASSQTEGGNLELRWARTAELPFARKQLAPFTGPAFSVSTGQPSTTIVAPGEPGRYDLLLFADGGLLEALPVSVQ